MIDCSHDNSGKDHQRQPAVARDVAAQIAAGERGIAGLMIESFLLEGRQDLRDRDGLTYGQSVTDSCIGWDTTTTLLRELAAAVRARRAAGAATRASASTGSRTLATSR
jgi:3-deoxy-7-phosphoheptulonate synthase